MDELERAKLLSVHSIGPRMVALFAQIGMTRLSDFAGADPHEIALRINSTLGRRHINRAGVDAIRNVIAAAARDADG
jgi:hypothetical protein